MTKENLRRVLDVLRRDGRLTDEQIAERLALEAGVVKAARRELEEGGVIRAYTVIANEEAEELGESNMVHALIEVQVQPERDAGFNNVAERLARFPEVVAVYLVSGRYDLRLEVVGKSLQEVANFVAAKLSSQDGVKSTATSFMLKKYKEAGIALTQEEKCQRLQIVP